MGPSHRCYAQRALYETTAIARITVTWYLSQGGSCYTDSLRKHAKDAVLLCSCTIVNDLSDDSYEVMDLLARDGLPAR